MAAIVAWDFDGSGSISLPELYNTTSAHNLDGDWIEYPGVLLGDCNVAASGEVTGLRTRRTIPPFITESHSPRFVTEHDPCAIVNAWAHLRDSHTLLHRLNAQDKKDRTDLAKSTRALL